MLAVRFVLAGEAAECGLCSGTVDRLRRILRRRTEGRVLGDGVPVAIGGDCAGVPSPRRCLARVARRVTERPRPASPASLAVSNTASARASISSRRSSSACRISSVIGPSADGISPAISPGALRVRPEPAGRVVARATR